MLGRDRQVAGVDGHVDVGRGVVALGLETFTEVGVWTREKLNADVELLHKGLERNFEVVVATGVDLNRALGVTAAAGQGQGSGRGKQSKQQHSKLCGVHRTTRYRRLR